MKSVHQTLLVLIPAIFFYTGDRACAAQESDKDVFDLELFSLSKHKEDAFDAPAAVYIITSEDIRRSGATTLPETFRLVPGLQVAQQSAHKWVVGSRGFDFQFTNGLLVLIDGRTIYTPQFSGVFWDNHDIPLENIDKIEVIRGPGATAWGANAFNGVINIITKNASITQGNSVVASASTNDHRSVSVRHGGKLEDGPFYRIHAKRSHWGDMETVSGTDANDKTDNQEVGFRADWDTEKKDKYSLQGGLKSGESSNFFSLVPDLSPPYTAYTPYAHKFTGAHAIGNWEHRIASDSVTTTQIYVDYIADKTTIVDREGTTFDFDFQHVLGVNEANQLTWGVGYRYIIDDITPDDILLTYRKHTRLNSLYSAFLQNELTLIPETLSLTIGSKLERNDYTGFEVEPSIKLAYYPDDRQTLWGSISKAVRTPSRGEYDSVPRLAASAAGYLVRVSQANYQSEELVAYEIGYRVRPYDTLVLEATAFYNDYNNLRTFESGIIPPSGNIGAAQLIANNGTGETQGVELNAKWQVNDKWRLLANYSFLHIDLHRGQSNDGFFESIEGQSPENQFGIRSFYNILPSLEFNTNLYWVDNRPTSGLRGIDSYVRMDQGIIWRPNEQLELALQAENLFSPSHLEYQQGLFSPPIEIPRTVFIKITLEF